MKVLFNMLVLVSILIHSVNTKTTKIHENLNKILEKDQSSDILAQISNEWDLDLFFQPARQIQPKQARKIQPKKAHNRAQKLIAKPTNLTQLTRTKRKPILLDVRIPSGNKVQPQELTTNLLTEPTTSPLPLPPEPDMHHKSLPSYLSTLYLSDLTTLSPEGLKSENSTHQEPNPANEINESYTKAHTKQETTSDIPDIQSNMGLDDVDNIVFSDSTSVRDFSPQTTVSPDTDLTSNNQSELSSFNQDDRPTTLEPNFNEENQPIGDSFTTETDTMGSTTAEPVEEDVRNSPSKCYTHTMSWLGRCVVLCEKILVRPCVFYIGD